MSNPPKRVRVTPSPSAPPDPNPIVREIADMLMRIEVNYEREGSGPGSRFAGERLETVQARAVVRALRDSLLWDLSNDDRYRAWYRENVDRLDEIDEDMTHAAAVYHYIKEALMPLSDQPGGDTRG